MFPVDNFIAAEIEYRAERAHQAWGTRPVRRSRRSNPKNR